MFDFDRQRILAIAREAVSRNGVVVYADYDEYLRELICQGELNPTHGGWCQRDIKDILRDQDNDPQDLYRYERVGNKAHFYPLH